MSVAVSSPFVRAEPVEAPKTLAEAAYRRLRNDILWGQLLPGAALRSDELRRVYAIGISPLREALSRLTTERLVTASAQRGFRVAPLTTEDVRDTMETRIVLEREALTRSIATGDLTWEKDIVATFHAMSRLPIPYEPSELAETWVSHHRNFHMALIAACGSQWQLHLAALLYDQAERHRLVTFRIIKAANVSRQPTDEHRHMMEAALARDTRTAIVAMENHYRTTAMVLIGVMEKNGARIDGNELGLGQGKAAAAARNGAARKSRVRVQ